MNLAPSFRAAVLVAAALACGLVPADAAAQARPTTLSGIVTDGEGTPLAEARVTVLPSGRRATTGPDGRWELRRLAPGRHRVLVSRLGHVPAARDVEVAAGAAAAVDFALEATPLALEGIQATGTAAGQDPLAVTQATAQLSGRELEREMAGTIAQTLSAQPGVRVRWNGPAAAMPVLRGLTGDRVLVLQDGQRTADLAGSATDHGVTIDPLAARRVEVVRGPATLLYGNNALGGVVNVISDDVPTHVPARPEAAASLHAESALPGAGAGARATLPLGERWALSLRGAGRSTDDVRIGDHPVLGGRLRNTDAWSWNAAAGVGRVGERAEGGVAVRGYRFAYGLPMPGDERGVPTDTVRLDGRRWEAAARAELRPRSAVVPSVRVDATAQDYAHDELDAAGGVRMAFGLRTGAANVLVRQGRVGPLAEGAWGVSALEKRYSSTGAGALTPAADSRALGVFGFQEVGLGVGSAALQLGGRWDRYEVESRDSPKFGPGLRRVFRALSGSAGVRVPLAEGVSASVTWARSFRAPTVEELFSGALHAGTGSVEYGTPTLRAERGRGAEAVLRVRDARWSGQLALFHSRIDGFVHLHAEPDTLVDGHPVSVFRYVQDDATLRGVEGSVEWAARRDVVLGLTGDWLRGERTDGTPLSYMPPPRLGASARWDDGRWSLGAALHHEARQDRVGVADEGTTPAHTTGRLDAGFRWTRGGTIHSVTLRAENLTDELHREATSRIKDWAPNPGRNVTLVYRTFF